MFHLIKNKKSVKIPHRLPIEHAHASAESCKGYSTIVFAKSTTKCQNTEKRSLFWLFFAERTPDRNSIQIEIDYLAITLGSGRYFVKVTSSALMSKLQLQLFYRLNVCRSGPIYQNGVLIYCFGKQFFVRPLHRYCK